MDMKEWLYRNMVQREGTLGRQPEGDVWRYPPVSSGSGNSTLSSPYYEPQGMMELMLRDLLMRGGSPPQAPPQGSPLMGQNPPPPQMPKTPGYDPMIDEYNSNRPKYFGR